MRPWLRVPCDYRDPIRRRVAYQLYWCDDSSFGQVLPRPSEAEVTASYDVPDYYTRTEHSVPRPHLSFANRVLQHLTWRLDSGAHLDAAVLTQLAARGYSDICDLGCGSGALLQTALAAGFSTAVGIEPDPVSRAAAAVRGLVVFAGTAESIPAEVCARRFDVVTISHALEHTLDPVRALRNAAALLDDRGTIMIEVPNNEANGLRIAGNCWGWLDVPRHLNFFTTPSLKAICKLAGLKPIKTEYAGYCRQFSVEWQAIQAHIHKVFESVGGAVGTLRPGTLSYWFLLVRTAFAAPARKYDSVRVWAQKG